MAPMNSGDRQGQIETLKASIARSEVAMECLKRTISDLEAKLLHLTQDNQVRSTTTHPDFSPVQTRIG